MTGYKTLMVRVAKAWDRPRSGTVSFLLTIRENTI